MRIFYPCLLLILCLAQGVEATPFFTYTKEEIASLASLDSDAVMSRKELQRWDRIAAIAIGEEKLHYHRELQLYTYLYVAQREAAALSLSVKGCWKGSLGPISCAALQLFLKSDCLAQPSDDPYSNALAALVMAKLEERLAREEANCKETASSADGRKRSCSSTWIPWFARPVKEYWPPPPPKKESAFWISQLWLMRQAQDPLTRQKIDTARVWAGIHGPGLREWRLVANHFLFSHPMSLGRTLQVRAVLSIGIYDGTLIVSSAKEHFAIPRPFLGVCHPIPMPSSDAYPSGHATDASIAERILSTLLPENRRLWHALAKRASLSRVWGGVHRPIEIVAGWRIGIKIADSVLHSVVQPEFRNRDYVPCQETEKRESQMSGDAGRSPQFPAGGGQGSQAEELDPPLEAKLSGQPIAGSVVNAQTRVDSK